MPAVINMNIMKEGYQFLISDKGRYLLRGLILLIVNRNHQGTLLIGAFSLQV